MRLRNVLIVVKDMERSIKFYHDLFGLDTVVDQDGNVILTEGLVLQDEKLWKKFLGREVIPENNSCELYFEEREFDCFVEKLERLYPEVQYVNRPMTHSWGPVSYTHLAENPHIPLLWWPHCKSSPPAENIPRTVFYIPAPAGGPSTVLNESHRWRNGSFWTLPRD